jgi:hypothetical protein
LGGLVAAGRSPAEGHSSPKNLPFHQKLILGIGTLALLSGCASHTGVSSNSPMVAGADEPYGSRFGTIALVEQLRPARFSFQKAKGKKGSAKEAILDSANLGLSGLGAGVYVTGAVLSQAGKFNSADPLGYSLLAGAAVGAEGLYRSMKSVSPMELAQCEAALTNALSDMAQQQPFRDALIEAGADKIPGGVVWHKGVRNSPDAILEACVDELRLERAGSSEGSYFLHIKTHAWLTRVVDGAICFEQSAEYRSGTDLFLDWTLQGAVQSVAETGYKALARFYIHQLLTASPD